MPGDNIGMRCLLTGLHVLASLAACGSLVAVLLQGAQDLSCLPPVANAFGDPVPVEDALSIACDAITYSSGIICGLNLIMAVLVNCFWRNWCWAFLHQILTVLMCLVSVGSGSALTIDFILWCESLQDHVSVHSGCEEAADYFDKQHSSSNMTAYFNRMEMQQACQWAVIPFAVCGIFVYSLIMKTLAQPQGTIRHVGGRYFLLCDVADENAPLIPTTATLLTNGCGQDNSATASRL